MIASLTYLPLRLLSGVVAIGHWARRHPRWASFLVIAAAIYVTGFVIGSAAHADPLGAAHPDLTGDGFADQQGVRASHYASLFIASSKGIAGSSDPGLMATSWLLNAVWSIVFNCIISALGLFQWVAEFGWVQVIATPAEGIAKIVNTFMGQFQLTAFAMFLCGVVAGLYVMRNKWPAALIEVGMTIAMSVLAAGLFANPIQWLTASNGPLDQAKEFGGQVSAAMSGSGYLQGEVNKKNVIDDTITAPLVQVFIVDSNQVLSFGHLLKGECAKTFYKTIADLTPNTDPNAGQTIHNAVASCDKDAASFADNPSLIQLPEALSVGGGTTGLFFGGIVFAVLAIGCVVLLFWDGLRLMMSTIIGMFPFSDRSKFWKALFGVFACLVGIVFLTGLLALYLSALSNIITGLMQMGVPLMSVMNTITVFICLLFVLLLWQIISIRKRGHKVGEFIHDKLQQSKHFNPGPVMGLPGIASLAAAKQLLPKKKALPRDPVLGGGWGEDNRIQMMNIFGGGPQGPLDVGHVSAAGGGGGGPRTPRGPAGAMPATRQAPALARGATKVASGALRLTGAATGGMTNMALEAGKMVGQAAVNRVVVDKNGTGHIQRGGTEKDAARTLGRATTDPGITKQAPSRRISVTADGVGRVVQATRPTFVVPATMGPQP